MAMRGTNGEKEASLCTAASTPQPPHGRRPPPPDPGAADSVQSAFHPKLCRRATKAPTGLQMRDTDRAKAAKREPPRKFNGAGTRLRRVLRGGRPLGTAGPEPPQEGRPHGAGGRRTSSATCADNANGCHHLRPERRKKTSRLDLSFFNKNKTLIRE